MASEDFSFPEISNPLPSFAISPSLWRVSSVVYPEYWDDQENDQKEVMKRNVKVYSCFEFGENDEYQVPIERGNSSIISSNDPEKMDMLWEDFHDEELRRIGNSDKDKNKQPEKSSSSSSSTRSNVGLVSDSIKPVGRVMQIYDCQGKRRSKMVAFVERLKRIFLLDPGSRIKKH